MQENKIVIRGVNFDNVDMNEALEKAKGFIENNGSVKVVHTPNSEIVQLCVEQNGYYSLINSADIILPDGSGVILASKLLHTPLTKGKVAGVEFGEHLAKMASEHSWKLFLFGGKPGIAEAAADKLKEKYPKLEICGTNDGYIKDESADNALIEKINLSGADILYVCTGVPRQEKWMYEHRDKLNVKLMAGLGGSLDIYSGTSKRAPDIFIKLGLEWFYRLIKEPQRIGRMMKLPKFIIGTVFSRK